MGIGIRLSDTTLERFAWQERALCATEGRDFFPSGGASPSVKKFCKDGCPVIAECLAFALEHGCDGIWGGTTAKERQLMQGRTK